MPPNRLPKGQNTIPVNKVRGLPQESLINTLRKNKGQIKATAEELGITYTALLYRIDQSRELQSIILEHREIMLDIAEANLLSMLNNGDWKATRFVLETQGRRRGYVRQMDVNTLPDDPKQQGVDVTKLSTEELKQLATIIAKGTVSQSDDPNIIDVTPEEGE